MGKVLPFPRMPNREPKPTFRPTRFRVEFRLDDRVIGTEEGTEDVLFCVPMLGTADEGRVTSRVWHLGQDSAWHDGAGLDAFVRKYPSTEKELREYYAGFGLTYEPPTDPETWSPYRSERHGA